MTTTVAEAAEPAPVTNSDRLDDLSIVVLSYNRREEIKLNLPELCRLHVSQGAELIIVDNDSTDGTRLDLDALRSRLPTIKILTLESNRGVAGGRNAGWAAATRRFILNLDDDTRIDVAAVRALRAAAVAMPGAGIFSPKVIHAETGRCQNGHGTDVSAPANFHGACHLLRAEVWRTVGSIDPECNFGGEELDYAIRARASGFGIAFLPHVEVRHNSVARPGPVGRWRRQRWVYNFSRIFFKHFPARDATLLLLRYLTSQLAGAAAQGDLAAIPSLARQAIAGAANGRGQYRALPPAVLTFYRDPRLTPDFGNRPLSRKLIARFSSSH
jgi:GT2 family glycosyltransferase